MDLINEGNLGLIKAAKRFNLAMGAVTERYALDEEQQVEFRRKAWWVLMSYVIRHAPDSLPVVEEVIAARREGLQIGLNLLVLVGGLDLIAEDIPDLLAKLDGRKVMLPSGEVTLETASATVRYQGMTWRQRFLAVLSHPQFALMLLSLGSLGLFIELYSPGLIFPGVIGAISLVLAFYSLQTLPVNYAGLALICLATSLFSVSNTEEE